MDKAKVKAKKGKGEKVKAEQLLDLNSSWDSTAQTSPGISSFAKDTSQILLPLRSVQEEEEEGGSEKARSPTPPVPRPRSASVSPEPEDPTDTSVRCLSVARLSKLFDTGAAPAQGWSSAIQPATSPKKLADPEDSDYTNLDQVSSISPLTARDRSSPTPVPVPRTSPPPPLTAGPTYKALYDYQAADDSEVTLVEGGVVALVPRDDASPGWLMVRLEDGSEGWVPESYLEAMAKGTTADDDEGVSKATGQVMPLEPLKQSVCKYQSLALLYH